MSKMKNIDVATIDGQALNLAVAMAVGRARREPRAATNDAVKDLTVPFTMYEVISTFRGANEVSARVAPITVVRYGVNHEAGESAPSITFVDNTGRDGTGEVDMFFLTQEEADLEVQRLLKGGMEGFDPANDWLQCGKLIDENGIMFLGAEDQQVKAYLRSKGPSGPKGWGSNHRVAALRCLLADKVGQEVSIPAELIG